MSIVRGLALAHLSATTLLLLLFVVLISAQRLVAAVRGRPGDDTPVAYPSDEERSAVPAQDTPAQDTAPQDTAPQDTAEGTSVLEWHLDLRDDERPAGSRELQRSS